MPHLEEISETLMHEPVMKSEALRWLGPVPGDCIIDCTAGRGGHAEEILRRVRPGGKLVAIDRDPEAVLACKERLAAFADSLVLVCDNYRNILQIRNRLGLKNVDGVLIDCGVSSAQLESAERGFSFQEAGPLDMRMDTSQPMKLADLLRRSTEAELRDIIGKLGQERFAGRIARTIKQRMAAGKIHDTGDLAQAVRDAVPGFYRHGRIHPATRTFQALRIKVNDELDSLAEAVAGGVEALSEGGRMVVISFHSLEDGIVKRGFREAQKKGAGSILTKKPLEPGEEETASNPRSRSAKLRVFEKGARPFDRLRVKPE